MALQAVGSHAAASRRRLRVGIGIDRQTYDAQLATLTGWVNDVLRPGYPSCALADCWAAHPDAVIELGNIRAQWRLIYERDRARLPLALEWHDRWWPNAVRRINVMTARCRGGCIMQENVGRRR